MIIAHNAAFGLAEVARVDEEADEDIQAVFQIGVLLRQFGLHGLDKLALLFRRRRQQAPNDRGPCPRLPRLDLLHQR
jgi:hypothetical protein